MSGIDFTVVIPAYEQGRFLAEAIRSALQQVEVSHEVIVVDDGSTDETADVIADFGDAIVSVRQENQGLAAARNTGIARASGQWIALLDADDAWEPGYLAAVSTQVKRFPGADGFYTAARCVDEAGHVLPQRAGALVLPPTALRWQLLRANFIIPSAVVLRRDSLEQMDGFAEGFPGVEDLELWLRLLGDGRVMVGWEGELVRYRIHGASMSTSSDRLADAKRAVFEAHFGLPNGDSASWPADKRRAYGGLHRYQALMAVQRLGRPMAAADALCRALRCDPTVGQDEELFYEMALGSQPVGRRGPRFGLDVAASRERLSLILASPPMRRNLDRRGVRQVSATANRALARVAYEAQLYQEAMRHVLRVLRLRPRELRDAKMLALLLRVLVRYVIGRPPSSMPDADVVGDK